MISPLDIFAVRRRVTCAVLDTAPGMWLKENLVDGFPIDQILLKLYVITRMI